MSRSSRSAPGYGPGFPRSRGDEPTQDAWLSRLASFSPLTRG
ncbi:hypothetical protein HMPREF1978_01884 [Actinomyces graevenitzii F0530]|uniref:Uncharacterized protein n=1 Tax=Actinomyces graevenitzii F0530 TaxID=1321817 RepID=U1PUM0_9ACTO|nr:hypothetical protein HMPREF1978_01884 [Actinomyces graevenitzii F0530]